MGILIQIHIPPMDALLFSDLKSWKNNYFHWSAISHLYINVYWKFLKLVKDNFKVYKKLFFNTFK